MYQTFKFFIVRLALSFFLLLFFVFWFLYFSHEVARSPEGINEDVALLCLAAAAIMIGFLGYGFLGNVLYAQALKRLQLPAENEKARLRGFENLRYFTFSSYFLPGFGRRLRQRVIRDYADYLLSAGKTDLAALKIFVKAFLQDPAAIKYHAPVISVLRRTEKLRRDDLDLLLLLCGHSGAVDELLARHLAPVFLRHQFWTPRTEAVLLAAARGGGDVADEVLAFALPRLARKKRRDETAAAFYLLALSYPNLKFDHLREIVGLCYLRQEFAALNPALHHQCEAAYLAFDAPLQAKIRLEAEAERQVFPWRKSRPFDEEDRQKLADLSRRVVAAGAGLRALSGFWRLLERGMTAMVDALAAFYATSWRFKALTLGVLTVLVWGVMRWTRPQPVVTGAPPVIAERKPEAAAPPENPLAAAEAPEVIAVAPVRMHTLQIAATTDIKKAHGMMDALRQNGVSDVYITQGKRRDGGAWYKVRAGKFTDPDEAKRLADRLLAEKLIKNYFVISYSPQSP